MHTVTQNQTEAVHNSVGLANRPSGSGSSSPAVVLTINSADGERVLADQLLETWMLLEYCDQGNLEAAARESRFKNDFVSCLPTEADDLCVHKKKPQSLHSECHQRASLSSFWACHVPCALPQQSVVLLHPRAAYQQ